jgi:hypothetical protein
VHLHTSVVTSLPPVDEIVEMWINAGASRARLLVWNQAMAQAARNASMANPDLGSDGRLREPLLAQGHDLLILGQTLLSLRLTQRNALWKQIWRLGSLRSLYLHTYLVPAAWQVGNLAHGATLHPRSWCATQRAARAHLG